MPMAGSDVARIVDHDARIAAGTDGIAKGPGDNAVPPAVMSPELSMSMPVLL